MQSDVPAKKTLPWLKIAAVAVLLLIAAVLVLRGVDRRSLIDQAMARIDQAMELIQAAGPVVFFLAMALLPCLGVPSMPFLLVAGAAFGDDLGLPLVVTLSVAAILFNLAFSYFLARRALRPLLERLVARLGYKLPNVEAGDAIDLVIICRVTPGVPFFVQNYLLGLANVPFGKYMAVSSVISGLLTVAFVVFGKELREGRGGAALVALTVVIALMAGMQLLRRHYARKKSKP